MAVWLFGTSESVNLILVVRDIHVYPAAQIIWSRDPYANSNSVVELAEGSHICCSIHPSPNLHYRSLSGGAGAVAGAELAAVGGPARAGGGVRGAALEEGGHRHVGVADQRDHQLGLGREGRQGVPPGGI